MNYIYLIGPTGTGTARTQSETMAAAFEQASGYHTTDARKESISKEWMTYVHSICPRRQAYPQNRPNLSVPPATPPAPRQRVRQRHRWQAASNTASEKGRCRPF
jgi:hypothetical protein